MKTRLFLLVLWAIIALVAVPALRADTLLLANKQQISGELSLIADDYIEFRVSRTADQYEWIKVSKKILLAVLDDQKKIVYPRDKYDENALNYGKVRLRNEKEARVFLQRKKANQQSQLENEKSENGRYKVAAIIGSLSGLMLWAMLDSK